MTRKDIRDRIKLIFGLDPDREDGNLTNAQINMGINDALKRVFRDVNMVPVQKTFPLVNGQWKYPMTEDMDIIRSMYFIDSNGEWCQLKYNSLEQFMRGFDPESDTSDTPEIFSYPFFQNAVIEWYAGSGIYDYVTKSYITESTIRTLVDSGANFGRTLSGYRIEPKAIVHNLTDHSVGYVRCLNILTALVKATGMTTAGTSTTKLYDSTKNFTDIYVEEGDIIVIPSTGMPQSYGFITEVGTDNVTYADMRGANTRVKIGDTYKIGRATEIVLSEDTPHPGLRNGTANLFTISAEKATVIGATTYTLTRVTGTVTPGTATPVVGDIVIANDLTTTDEEGNVTFVRSGGQHGTITAVASDLSYLDVDMWIGGKPDDGQLCTIKECDQYQIEAKNVTQRVLCIAPTPDTDDSAGSESIVVFYNKKPSLPEDDDDLIELDDDRYQELLLKCGLWQSARLSGRYINNPNYLMALEQDYKLMLPDFSDNVYEPPLGSPINAFGNRVAENDLGGSYRGAMSGHKYNI